MSAESYKQVLDLMQQDMDWKKIVFEMAKRHPAVVLEAAGQIPRSDGYLPLNSEVLARECRNIRNNDCKLAAIKHGRAKTGVGLKEAKEYVESL